MIDRKPTLLDEYRERGIIDLQPEMEVLIDTYEGFLVSYLTRHGDPIVMGVHRNEETFWRNRKHD